MTKETGDVLTRKIVRLGRALREQGVKVSLADEIDAREGLGFFEEMEDSRLALLCTLRIPPEARNLFDSLFEEIFVGAATPRPRPSRNQRIDAPRVARPPRSGFHWDPDTRTLTKGDESGEGETPASSPAALLRGRHLDAALAPPAAVAAMEAALARLARRLATRRSRRLVPAAKGRPDLRRSLRRAVRTAGEPLSFARRTRALERTRLVFLVDTSGSMDPHARFLLTFLVALRRATRRAEVFAFNTRLERVTGLLSRGDAARVLARLADAVPDWSGGTRIGDCLADFAGSRLASCVDERTVVVVLSDGLDRGDPEVLASALARIARRARRIVWLNPLLGDPRYAPEARGIRAALPWIDRHLPVHDLASLERAAARLGA